MKNKTIFGLVLILAAAFSLSFTLNALGVKDETKKADQNFLTISIGQSEVERVESTQLLISGGSFTAGHVYCAMSAGIGNDNLAGEFTISVNDTIIGKCVVNGPDPFGSTILTSTSISPGTVVRIDSFTDANINKSAAVTIAP